MIRAGDRVARVLDADPALVEAFAAASPHFERLRDPRMRRVMARLVTVEQAARIAGVEVGGLLRALNGGAGAASPAPPPAAAADAIPDALQALPPGRLVDLDVRDDLRAGREPFSRIVEAVRLLPEGHALRLRATFEPAPLYAVLAKRGLAHWTERLADDDWRVWFHRAAPGAADPPGPAAAEPPGEGVVVLDVRGMEPPEPMARTLAALEALPPGGTLVQLNVRVPRFLLPRLAELGFVHELHEQEEGLVRVLIRRREARPAEPSTGVPAAPPSGA